MKPPGDEAAFISSGYINSNKNATRRRYVQRENYERQTQFFPSAVAASFKGWLPEEHSPLSTGAQVLSSEKQSIAHRACSQGITSI